LTFLFSKAQSVVACVPPTQNDAGAWRLREKRRIGKRCHKL